MSKTKYFNFDDNLKSFLWVGDVIKTDRLKGYDYYAHCIVNGNHVSLNDFVLVNNSNDSNNFQKAYIAEITELYDRGSNDGIKFCGTVKWYNRPSEIPQKFVTNVELHPSELFLNTMHYSTDIDLETILACTQVQKILNENTEPIPGNFIFTGREYDGKKVVINKGNDKFSPVKQYGDQILRSAERRRSIRKYVNQIDSPDLNRKCKTTPKRKSGVCTVMSNGNKLRKKLSFVVNDSSNSPKTEGRIFNGDQMDKEKNVFSNRITHERLENRVKNSTGALEMICDSSPVLSKNRQRSVKFQDNCDQFDLLAENDLNNHDQLMPTDVTPRKSIRRSLVMHTAYNNNGNDRQAEIDALNKTGESNTPKKITRRSLATFKDNLTEGNYSNRIIDDEKDNDENIYYLTGFDETDSKLVLSPGCLKNSSKNKGRNLKIDRNLDIAAPRSDKSKHNREDNEEIKISESRKKEKTPLKRSVSLRTPSARIKKDSNQKEKDVKLTAESDGKNRGVKSFGEFSRKKKKVPTATLR